MLADEQRERRQKLVDDRRGASVSTKELEPVPIEQFEAMLKDIKAQRNNKHYLRKVKNSLALGGDYISRFLRTNGALEQLVSVTLRSTESSCQLEALSCLTNLACGDHKATNRVLRSAGPYLITFLNGSNPFLQEQSAWCLANIARDCDECRELLKCQGASHAFVKALQSIYPQVVDMAVFALLALCTVLFGHCPRLGQSGPAPNTCSRCLTGTPQSPTSLVSSAGSYCVPTAMTVFQSKT
ncbi:hypothetical protein MTO96_025531 [Rhipicephalus appendiculatus]